MESRSKYSPRLRTSLGAGLALALSATLITTAAGPSSAAARNPGPRTTPTLIVGVIHVGSVHDAGYNQAEEAGIQYMKAHVQGVKVIEASNVPETPAVTNVMQTMINQGAKLIFPQSYGYQDYAVSMAQKNPASPSSSRVATSGTCRRATSVTTGRTATT